MPDSKEYKKGIYTNLQAKFGKNNLPDENTFYQKIDSDINYRKGVLTNLETAYGKENVPTFDDFENRLGVKKKELTPSPSSFGKYPSSLPEEVSPIMGGGKRVERQPVLDKRTTALNPLVALEETKGNAPLPQPKTEELQSFRQTGATFPDAEVDKSSGLPEIKGAALGVSSVVSSTLKSIGVAAKDIDLFNEYKGKKAEDLVTYKAGKWIEDKVKDLTGGLSKEEQDMFSVKLAQGVGQMGGFMLGGIGGKALKFSPVLTSAALGAAVNASSEYENAIQSGATPNQAAKVFWINGVIGTTEALPIMSAFNKLDKYTGGLATGALSRKLSSTIGGRITNEIAQGFVTEAAQEATQQLMTNTVAANTYDVTRSIYDGLLESAAIGGIIGASMNGVVSSIREKRAAGGLTKEEDTQLAAAQEFAEQKAAEALDPSKAEITTNTHNNPKVKSIIKAKTDIEADLAHNENLPEDTKATMQTEVEALDQELEVAKTETYQQELDSKTAMVLQDNIAKNEMLLEDATLTEGTKAIIQRNIDTDKEKLSQLPIPTPPIIEGKAEEIVDAVTPTVKSEEVKDEIFTAKSGNKVVDEKGEPITVYHGTNNLQDIINNGFDPSKRGETSQFGDERPYLYFSDNEGNSNFYAKEEYLPSVKEDAIENGALGILKIKYNNENERNVGRDISKMLQKETPIDKVIDRLNKYNKLGEISDLKLKEILSIYEASLKEVSNADTNKTNRAKNSGIVKSKIKMDNPLVIDNADGSYNFYSKVMWSDLIDRMENEGHDGLIIKNTKDPFSGDVYIIDDPSRIKAVEYLDKDGNKVTIKSEKKPIQSTEVVPIIPDKVQEQGEAGSVGVGNYNGIFSTDVSSLSDKGKGTKELLKPDGNRKVVMMSPDEYLRLVREGFNNNIIRLLKEKNADKDVIDKYEQKIRDGVDDNLNEVSKKTIIDAVENGDKLDMPFVFFNENGKMVGQDGRNRAAYAKEIGEKLIPVLIENNPTEQSSKETPKAGSVGVGGEVKWWLEEGADVEKMTDTQFEERVLSNKLDDFDQQLRKSYKNRVKAEENKGKYDNEDWGKFENKGEEQKVTESLPKYIDGHYEVTISDGTKRLVKARTQTDAEQKVWNEKGFRQSGEYTVSTNKAEYVNYPSLAKAKQKSIKKGDELFSDENGKPITFYHGTDKEFSEFKPSENKYEWKGIFFAFDKDYARWRNNKRIVEANLVVKNPLDVTMSEADWAKIPQDIKDAVKKQDIGFLKSKGYDAVILKKPLGKEIVVFDKSQIKEQSLKEQPAAGSVGVGGEENAWGSDKGLTENFYTTDVDGYAIKKPITNPSSVTIDGIDFHIVKVDGDWKVIEKKSGLEISTGKTSNTKSAAIEDATMRLEQNGGAENLPTLIDRAIQGFKDRNSKAVEQSLKEQPKEETTEQSGKEVVVEVAKPKEYVSKTGRSKIVYENGNRKVIDVKTGEEVSAPTARKVLREAQENYDYTVGEKATKDLPDFEDNKEHANWVVENSENPAEIATVFRNEEKEGQSLSTEEEMIAEYGIGKVKASSYYQFGDRNNMTLSKARNYLGKDPRRSYDTRRAIDVIAKEMSDHYKHEITPKDIVDFMDRFPNGEGTAMKLRDSEASVKAQVKFEKLTGLPLNDKTAEIAINQEFNKLSKQEQSLLNQDYETRQQLEDAYWEAHEKTNGFTKESVDTETKLPTKEIINEPTTEVREPIQAVKPKPKEQGDKEGVSEGTKPISEGGAETTNAVLKDKETKIKDFNAKADKIANDLIDFLTPKTTRGAATKGLTIADLVTGANKVIKSTYAASLNVKEAIDAGIKYFKENWKSEEHGVFPETALREKLASQMEVVEEKANGGAGKKPPTNVVDEGKQSFGERMRGVYKSIITRSKGLTEQQKELLKNDPNALYNTLPHSESRRIAKAMIEEIGVENAVLEATKKGNDLAPVERTMLLGAAMDYYAGLAKEQAKSNNEKGAMEAASNEIDAQEKMKQVASDLATLGTDYGRAISSFKDIYQLSNLALEKKLKDKVYEVNQARNKENAQQAKDIQKIVQEEAETVQSVANDLTETELNKESDSGKKISELEKEVADLKKQILERDNAAKGTKKNPLKIKRVTNDTEYDKRIKDFRQRQRTGISKDDLTDLGYFGLYHIENGVTKFSDWYKVMISNFKGFKGYLKDIYSNERDKAISNGADKTLFDTNDSIQEVIDGLQKESDAKKMAAITKKAAEAKLKQIADDNPDRARALAPKLAAERIRKDAEKNLDMPSTKVEQTYLKKLVQTINQKAKEYYKEKKENISNINDKLAFAIANGKKDFAIWDRTKEEVEKQIDADEKLTEEQKAEVKEFLDDYTESIFDTLLTKNQIDQTIREKLIESGYSTEKTINGKVVKSVDWGKVIAKSKNIKEAKAAIVKAITDLGFTEAEAKGEISAILDQFDKKVTERKTKDINAYLNKGILNKIKSSLGGKKATKTQASKLIEMNNKGMLDDVRVKDVLAQELGLISLSEADLAKVRELSEIIDNPDIPEFMRRQFEEQLQYIFDSKGGNLMYLENREAVMANRLSSMYNQGQNATGFSRTVSTLFTVALKTGKPILSSKIYAKELSNAIADAKTILLRGRVSRGSSFSDLTRMTEGEARVRYLEQGLGKLLSGKVLGKSLYAKVGGKTIDLNPLNAAYSKIKYINRSLETVDTPSSGAVSGLTQFWQINKDINKYYPELSQKEKSQKVWDIMYSLDREAEVPNAIASLKKAGVDAPTVSEINRTINEKAERLRNDLMAKEFYKHVESLKPMAETKLKADGISNPTSEQIQSETYKLLGMEEPLDVVARGERQAGRETGKTTTFGITSILLLPLDAIQSKIGERLRKNTTSFGKGATNTTDAVFSQLFPFAHSIARWIEMQLELTPYGLIKGIAYKGGLAKAAEGATKTKISVREYSELGDDYMIRSALGAGYVLAGMFGIGLAKSLVGDEDEPEDAIVGAAENKQYTQEKVESVGKPKQSVSIGGHNIPLQLAGNTGVVLGMYSDFLNKRKDPEYAERSLLFIGGTVAVQTTIEATWFNNASKYGGLGSAILSGKEDKSAVGLGKISGALVGSQIPFNRFQTEIATVMNPTSQASTNFGVNLANQLSIVRAFSSGKQNFDYRGRIYEYGDIYVNSANGVMKMFGKSKYGDKADEFLSKINFAATETYRETKEEENYRYAIKEKDTLKPRFMTPDEYYDFKLETAKVFDKVLLERYKIIDATEIKPDGKLDPLETTKFKKDLMQDLLRYAKNVSFDKIQAKSGYTPPPLNAEKILKDVILKGEKAIKRLDALGSDIFLRVKTGEPEQ